MSRTAPMRVFGLLLAFQVLVGRCEESNESIFLQDTPENIMIQTGKAITFQCATQKKTPIAFHILTNGISRYIACPGGSDVALDGRIVSACYSETEDGLRATWTIKEVAKVDNGTQVICSAAGQKNITSVLTVEESTEAAVADYVATPIVGPVVGGFLGVLFLFALIVCGLICCARCNRSEDDDKKQIATSFSNPSWSGNTDSTLETGSLPNAYEEPAMPDSRGQSSKHFPAVGAISGHSESTTDCVSA